MARREGDEKIGWVERAAFAAAALTTIAAASKHKEIRKQLRKATRSLGLPKVYEWARDETKLRDVVIPVYSSESQQDTGEVFEKLYDQDRGSQRYHINPEDIAFMSEDRTVLFAEAIINSTKLGLTAVHSCEIHTDRRTDADLIYFAVRLTPRTFKPHY